MDYDLGSRNLAEQNRHNLITEAQTDRAQEETGRHNIVTEENQRYASDNSAKATIESARIGAQASNSASKRSASATKYSARQSASASKYNADVKAATDAANRALTASENALNRQNQRTLADMNNDAQMLRKRLDVLINDKNISQKDRDTLKKYQGQLEAAQIAGDARMMSSITGMIKNSLSKLKISAEGGRSKSVPEMIEEINKRKSNKGSTGGGRG